MTISSIIKAPPESCREGDTCALCMDFLSHRRNLVIGNRRGWAVIHNSPNGALHPMHDLCFKKIFSTQSGTGICPFCREQVSWSELKNKDSLIEKIGDIVALSICAGVAHSTLSYLTGRPLLMATIPGVLYSSAAVESLWHQYKEVGLQYSLPTEFGREFKTSALLITIPLLAAISASQISDSIVPNSLITATLGVSGLFFLGMRFLDVGYSDALAG